MSIGTGLAYIAAWDSRATSGTVSQSDAVVISAEAWNVMVRDRNHALRLSHFASELLRGIPADPLAGDPEVSAMVNAYLEG